MPRAPADSASDAPIVRVPRAAARAAARSARPTPWRAHMGSHGQHAAPLTPQPATAGSAVGIEEGVQPSAASDDAVAAADGRVVLSEVVTELAPAPRGLPDAVGQPMRVRGLDAAGKAELNEFMARKQVQVGRSFGTQTFGLYMHTMCAIMVALCGVGGCVE